MYLQMFIAPTSLERRSISIHVMSGKNKAPEKGLPEASSSLPLDYKLIEDLEEFKSSLELYPRMRAKSLRQFYMKKR